MTPKAKREIYLPGNIGLPAPPSLTQVLQDGSGFVLFDPFWHHVQDVVHHSCPELQVEVRLHALLRDSLCDTLRVTAWKKQRPSGILTPLGSDSCSS